MLTRTSTHAETSFINYKAPAHPGLSEYGNIVPHPIASILSNTLRNPGQIAHLLLLQLKGAVNHTILELLQEGKLVHMYFHRKEAFRQFTSDREVVVHRSSVRTARLGNPRGVKK